MKTFLVLIVIAAAGYFAYVYLIKGEDILEVKASRVTSTSYSSDINAPALYPGHSGSIRGTVKNTSDKAVKNVLLKYVLDGKPVEAAITNLEPGEMKEFSTQTIGIRSESPAFFLDKMTYDKD